MTSKPKTTAAQTGLAGYLAGLDPSKAATAQRLVAIFAEASGFDPVLWGASMVGFGRYDYRYASGTTGSSLATGFALRAAEIVLYTQTDLGALGPELAALGPHRAGKGCVYLKRLDGVDEAALRRLIRAGLDDLARHWTILPR